MQAGNEEEGETLGWVKLSLWKAGSYDDAIEACEGVNKFIYTTPLLCSLNLTTHNILDFCYHRNMFGWVN